MTGTAGALDAGVGASLRHPGSASVADPGQARRFATIGVVVAAWMGLGWALHIGAVAYLLVGIPITIAFQRFVARRPLRYLWVVSSSAVRVDRLGVVIAVVLAALPSYVVVAGVMGGHILDVGYGLAGVVGAVPAAFALRAMDGQARRAIVRSLLTAGVVGGVLFVINRLLTDGAAITDPAGALCSFAISLGLYLPMVFVIEEVFFRGALDPYARGVRPASDMPSMVVVSLLWGVWHLPLTMAQDGLERLPITLGFHLVVGVLLTIPWRRSGNLAVPGITHALIDAVRDGLAVL